MLNGDKEDLDDGFPGSRRRYHKNKNHRDDKYFDASPDEEEEDGGSDLADSDLARAERRGRF